MTTPQNSAEALLSRLITDEALRTRIEAAGDDVKALVGILKSEGYPITSESLKAWRQEILRDTDPSAMNDAELTGVAGGMEVVVLEKMSEKRDAAYELLKEIERKISDPRYTIIQNMR